METKKLEIGDLIWGQLANGNANITKITKITKLTSNINNKQNDDHNIN